jgi:hypothetical protein
MEMTLHEMMVSAAISIIPVKISGDLSHGRILKADESRSRNRWRVVEIWIAVVFSAPSDASLARFCSRSNAFSSKRCCFPESGWASSAIAADAGKARLTMATTKNSFME